MTDAKSLPNAPFWAIMQRKGYPNWQTPQVVRVERITAKLLYVARPRGASFDQYRIDSVHVAPQPSEDAARDLLREASDATGYDRCHEMWREAGDLYREASLRYAALTAEKTGAPL